MKLLTLVDDIYGDLAGVGTCATGGTIAVGGHYSCSFSKDFAGDAGASQTDTVTATAADDEGGPASGTDAATVTLTNRPPTVVVGKTASPTVANVGDSVTFTISVHNTSFEAVTLTALSDDVYGNLDGRGTCATGGSIGPGATYTCSFSAVVTATETDTVTGHVADNEQTSAHDTASATVTVHPAKVTVVKTADAGSVAAGAAVGFTVTVHNSGSGIARDVTVTDPLPTDAGVFWILDDDAGGLCNLAAGSVACGPRDLAPGGSIAFHVTSLTTFDTADDSPVTNRACFTTTNAGGSCAAAEVVVAQPGRSLTLVKANDAPLQTLLLPDGTTAVLPTAQAGNTLTYTLTYAVSEAPVRSVVLTDVVPAGLAYVDGSATGSGDGRLIFAGYDATTRTLSWTATTLSTSGSFSYRVTVLADAAGLGQPLRNTARISSPETDPAVATSDVYIVVPPLHETELPPTEGITGQPADISIPGSDLWPALPALAILIVVVAFITPVPARVRRRKG